MKLPKVKFASGITKPRQTGFGGLNHSAGAGDGELWDMKNLSSDHYPLLATRQKRMKYGSLHSPGGLFSWEELCWVDGTDFCFAGEVKGQVTKGEKVFASMGSRIVIFPDKCCYDIETGEFRSLESRWTGTAYFISGTYAGVEAFANTLTADGVNWADYFRVGDAVIIDQEESAFEGPPFPIGPMVIREMEYDSDREQGALRFYENTFASLVNKQGDIEIGTRLNGITVKRTVPDLKFVCESENRLWGCDDTTIYACKLGDVFNWNVFDGLETDSYAVDTGSAGAFTGCITFRGYPTFFKEEHIYKVYGSTPSNFEVLGGATLGLASGSSRSLAVAGEVLFYLNRSGVMAYTGGIPQPIGAAFGTKRFRNAAGGSDGLKYYVSMEDETHCWGLYVYDTQRGLWHKEDDTHVIHFAGWGGNLYFLNDKGELWIAGNVQDPPAEATEEPTVEWMAEFADFDADEPNKKGISKVQIRLELEEGAEAQVWLMCDSDGVWRTVGNIMGEGVKHGYYLPTIPRRADHYRLKITGSGACKIYSIAREHYIGSELRSTAGRN